MSLPHSLVDLLTNNGENSIQVQPITNGLIHQTYRIDIEPNSCLLQSINTDIFTNPEGLIQNHLQLHKLFDQPGAPFKIPLPKPLRFPNEAWIFIDDSLRHWRLSEFITGTYTRSAVDDTTQAEALANFFARFTRHASNIDQTGWHIPLPGFHDLRQRFLQFEKAIRSDLAGRSAAQSFLINQLLKRVKYVDFFDSIKKCANHPLRMMHHDAKLSNVLIEERTEEWCCPIDLDTVMPGFFFSDLGDMVRSLCNGAGREDANDSEIFFRSDLYEALLKGYRDGMQEILSDAECQQLDVAGVLMTYMQSMRFLTDYLNGDKYYLTVRPGQNLDRAMNQFRLVEKMETYLGGRLSLSLSS